MKTSTSDPVSITSEFLKKNCVLRVPSSGGGETKYECVPCKTKRLTELTLHTHVANLKHSELIKRHEDGIEKYTDAKYHGQCLQYSLESLLNERCGGIEELEKRQEIVLELENIFQLESQNSPELEGVTVEMYGSSAFFSALKTSDINCFLRVKEYLLCVKRVQEIISENDELYEPPTITSGYKFPRIQFVHRRSSLKILLSVHSPKSENFTSLMTLLLTCDEKAIQLARLMRIHGEEMNLLDGTFANHMFYILAVYFAQNTKPPLLPKFVKDYDDLMSKSEEDRCNREERAQRREAEKLKELEKQKIEKKRTADDVAIENFSAAVVKDCFRLSLIHMSLEDGLSITGEEVDRIMEEGKVDSIFPEVTPETDPWNSGGIVATEGEDGSWNEGGWGQESSNPISAATTSSNEADVVTSMNKLSLQDTEKEDSLAETKEDAISKAADECKIKLSMWGDQYLEGVRSACYSWEPTNDKQLHQLFQEMIRFYAKFNFESKTISLCRSSDDPENTKYSFVEDPFQPGTNLYNVPQNARNKKNKKMGRSRIYHDMTKHVKTVFETLRHYYECPHKISLCLSSSENQSDKLPPYSPFEFAVRFTVPAPFSDDHKLPLQEKLPTLDKVTEGALIALDRIVDKITEKYKLSPADHRAREQTFEELGDLVRRYVNPNIRPHWFGSTKNGLVLNTSDMDITLDVSKIGPVNPTSILNELAGVMKGQELFILEELILQARVPIIKFRRTDNDLTGDIAVGNMLAISNTRLIKAYTEIDERVPRLGLLVKAVVKSCECADASTGSLSSYAYTMMVIYFLQQVDPPVVPVLQEINRPRDIESYKEDGWDTYFYSDIHQQTADWPCDNTDSVALLALKFFKFYYEEIDYSQTVIAPKQKAHLSCTDKHWFRPINIEDPFNLEHNLGKQVSSKTFDVIKTVFRQAYLRYLVGPVDRTDQSLRYYLEKSYLLDGKKPPVNFICFGCGSRDHYVSECPNKNRCSHCSQPDHSKSSCPKIECFQCKGHGHVSKNCPNRKQSRDNHHSNSHHGNNHHNNNHHNNNHHGNSPYKKDRISPDRQDHYDRKNWIGDALRPADVPIGKTAGHYKHQGDKQHGDYFKQASPRSPAMNRVMGAADHRTNGEGKEFGGRRPLRTVSESSEGSNRKQTKKKKRTSSETKERSGSDAGGVGGGVFLGDHDLVIPKWSTQQVASRSDPQLEPEVKEESKVLRVKTKDVKESKKPSSKKSEVKAEKVKQPTHVSFMAGSVNAPLPQTAKEDSRQRKSRSMMRKDLFGDQKPTASAVNTTNKRQNVKTGKVKVPAAPGSGRKATKTEIWEDPGVVTEGSRYGPKREEDDFAEFAPDFFEPAPEIFDPDPNNLSEWGDLTPCLEGDAVTGASLQQEIASDWIGYLSSSPEKPAVKPQPYQPIPQQSYNDHIPSYSPSNVASRQLLDQLQGSPHKNQQPGNHGNHGKRGSEQSGKGKQGGKQRNKNPSNHSNQDPYLAGNNKRKNNRNDNFAEDLRYRDHRDHYQDQGGRHRNDQRSRDHDGYHGYYHDSPRKQYRDEPRGPGYQYHEDQRGYQDNSRGYHDNQPRGYHVHDSPRGYDQQPVHYRDRPRDYSSEIRHHDDYPKPPNSFMAPPSRPGYQPHHGNRAPGNEHFRGSIEPPNFDALKRRPGGKGRGSRGRN